MVSGCGSSRPSTFYDSTTIQRPSIRASERAAYEAQLTGTQPVTVDGVRQPARYSLAVLQAVAVLEGRGHFGAEVDLLVDVVGKGRVPVQVRINPQGAMQINEGRVWRPAPPPSLEALRSALGAGPLSGPWNTAARRGLAAALKLLSPRERALFAQLPLIRKPKTRRGHRGAEYMQRDCAERIEIYDRAFLGHNQQFIGAPGTPVPVLAFTLLHELGHAVHNRPERLAFCALAAQTDAFNAQVKRYNAAVSRYNRAPSSRYEAQVNQASRRLEARRTGFKRLNARHEAMQAHNPVLAAYQKALGTRPAPTIYGGTSVKESFAESFALYKADPAALRRVLPKVLRWFEGGGHLRALGEHNPS